jgi:hypothetical protein
MGIEVFFGLTVSISISGSTKKQTIALQNSREKAHSTPKAKESARTATGYILLLVKSCDFHPGNRPPPLSIPALSLLVSAAPH